MAGLSGDSRHDIRRPLGRQLLALWFASDVIRQQLCHMAGQVQPDSDLPVMQVALNTSGYTDEVRYIMQLNSCEI